MVHLIVGCTACTEPYIHEARPYYDDETADMTLSLHSILDGLYQGCYTFSPNVYEDPAAGLLAYRAQPPR